MATTQSDIDPAQIEAAARAWDEGLAAVRAGDVCGDPACCPEPSVNPYRAALTAAAQVQPEPLDVDALVWPTNGQPAPEADDLREKVTAFVARKAISARARGDQQAERDWLDLSIIVERSQPAPRTVSAAEVERIRATCVRWTGTRSSGVLDVMSNEILAALDITVEAS